jgi:hypothetical protein
MMDVEKGRRLGRSNWSGARLEKLKELALVLNIYELSERFETNISSLRSLMSRRRIPWRNKSGEMCTFKEKVTE